MHADEDDVFYVLDGELTFFRTRRGARAAGHIVLVPPGVSHTFRIRSTRPIHVLNIHAPRASTAPARRVSTVRPLRLTPSSGGPPSRRSRERRAYQLVLVGARPA